MARAAEAPQLLIYNWTDYTAPDLLKKFEAETGIKVTVDTYDSNETLTAKLRAGSTGYDIAVASSDFVQVLASQGLLQKIDASKMSNYGNLETQWTKTDYDPGNVYSVMWQSGTTSAAVDTAIYKGPTDTLSVLFAPPAELQGKIGMLGSPSEVMSLTLVYLGYKPCSAEPSELKAAQALLEKQKPFVKVYNSDGIIERQSSGETAISQVWSGDSMRARFQKPTLKYIYAKEGVVLWADNMVVPKTATHPENAKKFINFMMKPENAALETNFAGYRNPVKGSTAFVDKKFAEAPEYNPPEDQKMYFALTCPEKATRAYDMIWTRLRQ
jgi:spermidine/putrescine transport system substrate-binding protein